MNVGFDHPAQSYRKMKITLKMLKVGFEHSAQCFRRGLISWAVEEENSVWTPSTGLQRIMCSCIEDEESIGLRCMQLMQAESSMLYRSRLRKEGNLGKSGSER
ncbi:hypothetical protein NPIL_220521 [Nephila pilipes]|uniref:Uncharacterized protein n=1 Tax=Nephila pilipes TaxID=299642 RepID=A0A8X6R0W6_NEPPI|nr:hypothetical protein NPIL_220521 [Nephila pilipes]